MHSSILDAFADRYCRVSEANYRRVGQLAALLTRFAAHDIEVMLLKGADLLVRFYEIRGTRPLADIDLLVQERDLPAIDELLRASGFTPLIDGNPAYTSTEAGLILDITTNLWYLDEAELAALWRRATPQPIGSTTARVMATEDLVIHLTAYSVVHRAHLSEAFFQDLALLTHKASIDWDRAVENARGWRLSTPLFHGLSSGRRTRPDVRIPESALGRLAPASREDKILYWCLTRLVTGSPIPELGHLLLFLTQPPGRRWSWMRNVLAPPSTFLRYRYGEKAARRRRTKLRRLLHLSRSTALLTWRIMGRLCGWSSRQGAA